MVLGRYFAYKSSKDTFNCFFEEYNVSRPDMKWDVYELILLRQESVSMDEALKAELPSPLVARSLECYKAVLYFCGKAVLCEVPCLSTALFVAFASYVFNLEYPKPVKNIFYFFQYFIAKHPDSHKRSSTYLAITSDIKQFS